MFPQAISQVRNGARIRTFINAEIFEQILYYTLFLQNLIQRISDFAVERYLETYQDVRTSAYEYAGVY